MAEVSLGSFNLHMGRGTGGHDAPFYDVVAAAKEIDTDVLVVQEAFVADDEPGQPALIADALDYRVAASYADRPGRRARPGPPVRAAGRRRRGRLGDRRADPPARPRRRRGADRAAAPAGPGAAGGGPGHGRRRRRGAAVVGTHLPLLKDPVWRLVPGLRAALPPADTPASSPAT